MPVAGLLKPEVIIATSIEPYSGQSWIVLEKSSVTQRMMNERVVIA